MREIDDAGIKLCNYQADLFEISASCLNCSSPFFIKQFANSEIAKRVDNGGFLFEVLDVPGCLEELKKEKNLEVGTRKYPTFILSWIGYIYRYIAYTREISTKRLFSIIKPEELYRVYDAYHSLDSEEVTIRLFEAKKLNPNYPINALELAKKILI